MQFNNVSEVLTDSIIRVMIALMMEAVRSSETSVNFHYTALRNTLEDNDRKMHSIYIFVSKFPWYVIDIQRPKSGHQKHCGHLKQRTQWSNISGLRTCEEATLTL
jgi:hypothetical protein